MRRLTIISFIFFFMLMFAYFLINIPGFLIFANENKWDKNILTYEFELGLKYTKLQKYVVSWDIDEKYDINSQECLEICVNMLKNDYVEVFIIPRMNPKKRNSIGIDDGVITFTISDGTLFKKELSYDEFKQNFENSRKYECFEKSIAGELTAYGYEYYLNVCSVNKSYFRSFVRVKNTNVYLGPNNSVTYGESFWFNQKKSSIH